jgi:predicted RNase H-like HicB family nuclease
MKKNLEYYRRQPYERVLEIREEAGERYFLYRIKQIRAIAGDGPTKDEALANLRVAFDDYVTWALQERLDIPGPEREVVANLSRSAERVPHGVSDKPLTSGPLTQKLDPIAA